MVNVKLRIKNSNWYKFFTFKECDFLTIHVVSLLELKQTLEDFLNLEIYRAFIKLLDQIERKNKKK